jgi:hypothetical protein
MKKRKQFLLCIASVLVVICITVGTVVITTLLWNFSLGDFGLKMGFWEMFGFLILLRFFRYWIIPKPGSPPLKGEVIQNSPPPKEETIQNEAPVECPGFLPFVFMGNPTGRKH